MAKATSAMRFRFWLWLIRVIGVLAGLVLIRTFLSWTLVLEIEGRWPWQRGEDHLQSPVRRVAPDSDH